MVPMDSYPTVIRMTKAQAEEISVGEKYTMTLSGEVQGIRKTPGSDLLEVEIKSPGISEIKGNTADKAFRDMLGLTKEVGKEVGKQVAKQVGKAVNKNQADVSWDEIKG